MPWLVNTFGGHQSRIAFFAPIFTLTAVLLAARSVMTRHFDQWFATGAAFMITAYLLAEQLSRMDLWHRVALILIK